MFAEHFEIIPSGSIVLVEPCTEFAKEWWNDNVDSNCPKMGNWFAVECRYFSDIRDGFNFEMEAE
jgi:hypothetical protein